MSKENIVKDSYYRLYEWLNKESFLGYDPYDALNSKYFLLKKNKTIRLCFTHFNKCFPINLRRLLKIQKTKDKQGLSLIIISLLKFSQHVKIDNNFLKTNIDYLLSKSLKDIYGCYCWNGHDFPIQNTREFQQSTMPGIVGTASCASAIFEYYKKNPTERLRKVLLSVREFFLELLYREVDDVAFFRYKPMSAKYECIYNASIIAAIFILKVNNFFGKSTGTNNAIRSIEFVLSQQNEDGSWYYGIDIRNGNQKIQIDFHQGFILDDLYDFIKYTKPSDDRYMKALLKGAEFYKNEQFLPDGSAKWRWPRVYPIDIHNQAQGIITFSKLSEIKPEYLDFARTIAKWTIENMQDETGYFYYQKWPFFINKIPYMRWGQAWMMLALSSLLERCENS